MCNLAFADANKVLTNLDRTQIFGASLVPGDRYHGRYKWTLLNEDPGSIPTGFFFDALTREGASRKIDNIGITQHIHSLKMQEVYPMIPTLRSQPYMRGPDTTNSYLTVASFAYIRKLRINKIGPRLIGLAIHHHNGSIDVLGKWRDLPPGSSSQFEQCQIYHCKDGTLTSIAFGFSGDEQDARYVDTIFLGIDHKPRIEDLGPKFKSMMVFIVNEVNPVSQQQLL
jgi:hypothetical protein